jgi:Ketopantoate reductase PanE/ApbA C terminal
LLVTAFGGVGAVSRAPISIIRSMPETRSLLEQCMKEVSAVARARRIQLNDTVVADSMRYIDSLAANATTSLQRDIADGEAKRDRLLERFGGAARTGGRGLDTCKPVYLPQPAAAGIASTRQLGVSPMSRAKFTGSWKVRHRIPRSPQPRRRRS